MNFYSLARTNYFRVKSEAARRTLQAVADATNAKMVDKIEGKGKFAWRYPVALLWEETPCLDSIILEDKNGCAEPPGHSFETWVQPLLANKSVLIYQEVGNEGMRYLGASAWALCGGKSRKSVVLNLDEIYDKAAKAFKVDRRDISEAQY